MNIVEELKLLTKKLNEIDDYNTNLSQNLNTLDMKTQDILHYIENNKIGAFGCYRIIKELKQIRIERRKVKQDIELARVYDEHKNKLSSQVNRQFLVQEVCRCEKKLSTTYKNRVYGENEIKKICGGS